MNRILYRFGVLFVGGFLLLGCDSKEIDVDPLPPMAPPAARSTLHEIAKIKSNSINGNDFVYTRDGAYYADSEGIFKITYSGENELFVNWDQIPDFWKRWKETHDTGVAQSSFPPIYKMADDSLLIGGNDSHSSVAGESNVQLISKDGIPLQHYQKHVEQMRPDLIAYEALDESHALARVQSANDFAFEKRTILDLKSGDFQKIQELDEHFASYDQLLVNRSRVLYVNTTYNSRPNIFTLSIEGKLLKQQVLSKLLQLQDDNVEHYVRRKVFSIATDQVALWIYQKRKEKTQGSCALFIINTDSLTATRALTHIFNTGEDDEVSSRYCDQSSFIWLGGNSFSLRTGRYGGAQENIAFGTVKKQNFIQSETVIRDWRYSRYHMERTDDGSLALFETPKVPGQHARLSLINPDGNLRLSYSFDFDHFEFSNTAPVIFGHYMIVRNGTDIRLFKIEDAS